MKAYAVLHGIMRTHLLLAIPLCLFAPSCSPSSSDGPAVGSDAGTRSNRTNTGAGSRLGTGGGSDQSQSGSEPDQSSQTFDAASGELNDNNNQQDDAAVQGSDVAVLTNDASLPDAGESTVSGGCTGTSAKFCEDFDKQTVGQAPTGMFTLEKNNGATITVDGSKAYSGSQSLHLHVPKPGGDTKAQMAWTKPLLPAAANDLHGRAMVFMSRVPSENDIHWDLVTAFATETPRDDDTISQYTLGSMYGNFMAVYQPGDDSVDTNTKFPSGRWACIQWEFKGSTDGSHLLRMMLDGKVVDKGDVTKSSWKAPTFKSMKFGWINFQSANADVDMWIDDIAFGDQAIPCPAAR